MKDTAIKNCPWKPALLVIDMLEDFVNGPLGNERSRAIVPAVAEAVDCARKAGIPVIFCCDSHIAGVDKELELWGDHAIEGTPGAAVIPEMKVSDADFVVPKRRYSGFFQTGLDLLLRELGADTVILAGLYTNMCVRHTAADAYQSGYKVVLAKDAVCSMTEEEYETGIAYFETCYGALILSNEELKNKLEQYEI